MTKNEKATMLDALGKEAVLANFYARACEKYTDDYSARCVSQKRAHYYYDKVNIICEIMRALGFNIESQMTALYSGCMVYNKITVNGALVIESNNE